jgi:hypothetical protein
MKKMLMLVPPAALAAMLVPLLSAQDKAGAERQPQVRPAELLAAVQLAEAQRRAATPPRVLPAKEAADLDKVAGAAAKIDPARVDPKLALGALAR